MKKDFFIFQPGSFVLFAEPNSRRALIIDRRSATESPLQEVFRLSLPRNPKPKDWTQWQRPDFLTTDHAGWSLIYKQNMNSISTNIPTDSFEMRYKVETYKFTSYETIMKRNRKL